MTTPPTLSPIRRRGRRPGSADVLPQGFWADLGARVSRPEVLARLGLCVATAALLLVLVRGWEEPFSFRLGWVPPRGVVSRVAFEKPDPEATRTAQERASAKVRVVYTQDKAPVIRLRDGLKNRAAEISAVETLDAAIRDVWLEFAPEAKAAFGAGEAKSTIRAPCSGGNAGLRGSARGCGSTWPSRSTTSPRNPPLRYGYAFVA